MKTKGCVTDGTGVPDFLRAVLCGALCPLYSQNRVALKEHNEHKDCTTDTKEKSKAAIYRASSQYRPEGSAYFYAGKRFSEHNTVL